jgi:uncharacterized membrane protein YkvA (DUF1232 family)
MPHSGLIHGSDYHRARLVAPPAVTQRSARRSIANAYNDRPVFTSPSSGRRRKLVLALLIAYLLRPVDLVPDFIPVVGQLDDLIV